jgi:hypothetical protein
VLRKGGIRQLVVVPEANLLLLLSGTALRLPMLVHSFGPCAPLRKRWRTRGAGVPGKGGSLYAVPLQVLQQGFLQKDALADYAVDKAKGDRVPKRTQTIREREREAVMRPSLRATCKHAATPAGRRRR